MDEISRSITFLLVTWLLFFNRSSFAKKCMESERKALLNMEKDIYDPGDWLSSWREGGDCCSWLGVTCDNSTGNVVKLDLQYPVQYDNVNGNIVNPPGPSKLNPCLVNLTHLEHLDLSMNNFDGASIPPFIGSLVNLQYLDLSSTSFNGTLPPQLGNLSSLQFLYIYYDFYPAISRTLHADDLGWLSQLTSLNHLELRGVDLSRAVNWFDVVNMLPNLSILVLEYAELSSIPTTLPLHAHNNFTSLLSLDLNGNNFQSTLPSWLFNNMSSLVQLELGSCGIYGGLPIASEQSFSNLESLFLPHNHFGVEIFETLDSFYNLEYIHLGWNVITGQIPSSFWNNLTHLQELHLNNNHIAGSLQKALGNSTQLEHLDLSDNSLNGEIPEGIGKFCNLVELNLGSNKISGRIPESVGNLQSLTTFSLSNNSIGGEIPLALSNLTLLQSLLLSSNDMSGSIPELIGSLHNLELLDLSNNNFSGSIPELIGSLNNLELLDLSNNRLNGPMFFCNMSSLVYLDLSNNNLSGRLPWFQNKSSNLVHLYLSNNSLSGPIPDLFGSPPNLTCVNLAGNIFSGEIPPSLKNYRNLYALDLSENKLYGNIPPWIGEALSGLKLLILRSNQLSGHIPAQLSYLTSLLILDLSGNNLTGNLSISFENFNALSMASALHDTSFQEDFSFDNVCINVKGMDLCYINPIVFGVTTIDLSRNSLSGQIPNGLTHLRGLDYLNLSQNHFTGTIPENIGAMVGLEHLDLSTNNISGGIPPSISAITSLEVLNLSNNQLSGPIPSGNQFNTFDLSSYSGNQGLCGWPLPHCASNTTVNGSSNPDGQQQEEYGDESEMEWIYVSAALGFVISYLAVIGIIVMKQSVRYAYFRYVDKLFDWIYVKIAVNIARVKTDIMTSEE